LLVYINRAINDAVVRLNCLWDSTTLTGAYKITVVDYLGAGAAETITVTCGTAGAQVATLALPGSLVGFLTDIVAKLNALTGIRAWSEGVSASAVYVVGVDDTISGIVTSMATTVVTIANAGYESIDLSGVLTRVRAVRNIYQAGGGVFYIPVNRQQFDIAMAQSSGFTDNVYYVAPDYTLYIKAAGSNLTSSNSFTIDYYQYPASLTLASESPPGILATFDDLIIRRVLYYYYLSRGKYDEANVNNNLYERNIETVKQELRSHGEPQGSSSLYKWY
jgi:hypothetical protein